MDTLTDSSLRDGDAARMGGDLSVGDVLADRFEVGALLGRGGMGAVYRAFDRVVEQEVAIKVMLGAASAARVERLRRELRLARRVSHPSVLRIHDLVEVGDQLVLSMELVEGESLSAVLAREGRLPALALRRLARELSSALSVAHAAGVVHRDLKPSNILLRATDGRALLSDFGISCATDASPDSSSVLALTRTGEVVGTPLYMAPEQWTGAAGPTIDVYALGLVLHEAATGCVPHRADSVVEVMRRRVTEPVLRLEPDRADIDPGIRALILRCLASDPAQRAADGAAVCALLESGRIAPFGGSRRRIVLLALLAAVAAAGALLDAGAPLERHGPRGRARPSIASVAPSQLPAWPARFNPIDDYRRAQERNPALEARMRPLVASVLRPHARGLAGQTLDCRGDTCRLVLLERKRSDGRWSHSLQSDPRLRELVDGFAFEAGAPATAPGLAEAVLASTVYFRVDDAPRGLPLVKDLVRRLKAQGLEERCSTTLRFLERRPVEARIDLDPGPRWEIHLGGALADKAPGRCLRERLDAGLRSVPFPPRFVGGSLYQTFELGRLLPRGR